MNGRNWEIRCGDCLTELPKLPEPARLIVADPPYNIGINYGDGTKADSLPADEYLAWCRKWMVLCRDALSPDGSLWLVINDEWADHFGVMLTSLGLHRRNWLKWYERFGVNCTTKFNRTSRHIFYYVRDPKRIVFNREAVSRPSDRQLKYGDRRANPDGKVLDDVWGIPDNGGEIPRVAGTHGERIDGFPTQLPLKLLRRIVGCASEPGDLVVDPFSGSATTGAAAIELGRRYIGIELNPGYCERSRQRLGGNVQRKMFVD